MKIGIYEVNVMSNSDGEETILQIVLPKTNAVVEIDPEAYQTFITLYNSKMDELAEIEHYHTSPITEKLYPDGGSISVSSSK